MCVCVLCASGRWNRSISFPVHFSACDACVLVAQRRFSVPPLDLMMTTRSVLSWPACFFFSLVSSPVTKPPDRGGAPFSCVPYVLSLIFGHLRKTKLIHSRNACICAFSVRTSRMAAHGFRGLGNHRVQSVRPSEIQHSGFVHIWIRCVAAYM